MGTRLSNNIAKRKYLDRNKLFLNFRSGDLVQINFNEVSGRKSAGLRTITKNDKGSFTYRDKLDYIWSKNLSNIYTTFNSGQIGLFLGRYAGEAVVLLNEGMYAINVACIKKVEGNNG
jgi:hypothetical protein